MVYTARQPRTGKKELAAAARDGDDDAWEHIVREFGPTIRGLARAKGVHDPDDLTQDVFTAMARSISRFQGDDAAFRTWTYSIAYRQIVNRWRARDREFVGLPDRLATNEPGPEAQAMRASTAEACIEALDVLADNERDVVILSVIADLPTSDIALILDTTQGNIRVLKSRGLRRLRSNLTQNGYEVARPERKAG